MVTYITDKLQKQSLSDLQFEPINYETLPPVYDVWKHSSQHSPTDNQHVTGENDKTENVKKLHERRPKSTDSSTFRCRSTDFVQRHSIDLKASGDTRSRSVGAMLPQLPIYGVDVPADAGLSQCIHNKHLLLCTLCDDVTPGTPPQDPPKKRLCRSKSIPGDSTCGSRWQPKASSIWKPVGHRSHNNLKHSMKSRHSPHVLHKPKARRASPAVSNAIGNYSNQSSSFSNHTSVSCIPSSGNRYSPGGILKYIGSADNVVTPSESPVPRPASASSGFYDSSASQTSLNTSWTEGYSNQNCFSPHPPHQAHKTAFIKTRSLSTEEDHSASSITEPSWLHNVNLSTQDISLAGPEFGSTPVIFTGDNRSESGGYSHGDGASSVPSSPRRVRRVPRCRSQPCVMAERKHGGLKRRRDGRDGSRPSIDFEKMTESFNTRVSSSTSVQCTRPKSVTFAQEIQEIGNTRSLSSLYPDVAMDQPEKGFHHELDTIASSPLDSYAPIHVKAQASVPNVPNYVKDPLQGTEAPMDNALVSPPSPTVHTNRCSFVSPPKVKTGILSKGSSFKAPTPQSINSLQTMPVLEQACNSSSSSSFNSPNHQVPSYTTETRYFRGVVDRTIISSGASRQLYPGTMANVASHNAPSDLSHVQQSTSQAVNIFSTPFHSQQQSNVQTQSQLKQTKAPTASTTTPDVQWDSGCSDTNDPPDLLSFCESENSCDDHSVLMDEDTGQQFDLDIDLEQIEKD